MSPNRDLAPPAGRSTQMLNREIAAWRDSITEGCKNQDHALFRPGRVMRYSCSLALLEAAHLEPDPFSCRRIEVTISRFCTEGGLRRCSSVAAHPLRFSEGRGLLKDWTGGRNEVGALAPEEWTDHGIAIVLWRPHALPLACRYVEGPPGTQLAVGEETTGRWGDVHLPVTGPPIPNNHCDPQPIAPLYPWVHAAPRQLDLLGSAA